MLASLLLVLLGSLSSRFIVDEQQQLHNGMVAAQVAQQVAPVLAGGDLIRLEVSLRALQSKHHLLELRVLDVEGRALAATATAPRGAGIQYRSPITIEGNIAGECVITLAANPALSELYKMAQGLLALALLLSIFIAVLGARWGQRQAQKIRAATDQLFLVENSAPVSSGKNELRQLQHAVSQLPLDLLKPTATATTNAENYSHGNLLYIRLTSLGMHVETLDEASLLLATEQQRRLIRGAAELYGGTLSVVRQFGLLLSFGEGHNWGEPAFRAVSAAWLIKQVAITLNAELPLRMKFSLACGYTEAGVGSSQDIYPDLYNQHVIDELEAITSKESENILLMSAVASDEQVSARCRLANEAGHIGLLNFAEPYQDLLQRQQQLLLEDLRRP